MGNCEIACYQTQTTFGGKNSDTSRAQSFQGESRPTLSVNKIEFHQKSKPDRLITINIIYCTTLLAL